MNKVTLSVAALAAIGGTVQVQAAELSGDDLKKANETHYANLSIRVSQAITLVENKCRDVKDEYLTRLSDILKRAQKTLNDNKEEINETLLTEEIITIETNASKHQAMYANTKAVDDAYTDLTTTLEKEKTTTKNYLLAGPSRLAKLEAISLTEISNSIEAAKKDESILKDEVKEGILKSIADKKAAIEAINADIASADNTRAQNNTDYNNIKAQVATAKQLYQKEVQTVITNLPGEPDVYGDWQKEALKKLSEAYNKVLEAEKANEAAHAEDLAENDKENATGKKSANESLLNAAMSQFANDKGNGGIYNVEYETRKANQESWKKAVDGGKSGLVTNLTTLRNNLGNSKVSVFNTQLAEIENKITTLGTDIENAYKKHSLVENGFQERIDGIQQEITKINDDPIAAKYIQNYADYSTMKGALSSVEKDYNDKKTEASKKTEVEVAKGETLTYVANDHMSKLNGEIETAITNLRTKIGTEYTESENASTNYMNGDYSKDKNEATTRITNYGSYTTSAVADFKTAAGNIKDAKVQLAGLEAKVGENKNVTIDGTVKGTTYGKKIDALTAQIKAIYDQITLANTKEGSEHMTAMAAAAALNCEDVTAITNNFDTNKTNFENNVQINAADKVVEQAEKLVTDYTADLGEAKAYLEDGNCHKDKVEGKITDLEAKIKAAKAKIPSNWKNLDDQEKLKQSATIIAELSEVNNTLTGLKTDINNVKAEAEKAKKNYNNYKTLAEKTDANNSEVATKIAEVTNKVNSYGAYSTNWSIVISSYTTELGTIATNVENDYKHSDMLLAADEKVTQYNNDLSNLFNKVAQVVTDAANNESAKSTLDNSLKELQQTWQKVYDHITTTDKSSTIDTWLDKMAEQQKAVTKIVTDVKEAYENGVAYNKQEDLSKTINSISTTINNIKIEHDGQYSAAVKADNEKQHLELFLNSAYMKAEKAYTDAISKLNQYANIKNEAITTALKDLAETHANIYAYAEKLRTLKNNEAQDYSNYDKEGNTVIYSADKYIKTAESYFTEINSYLTTYVNTVNMAAVNAYSSKIKAAKKSVDDATSKVKGYLETSLPESLITMNKDITAAAEGVEFDEAGNPTDKEFALNLDNWTASIDNITKALPAALAEAAQNEYNARLQAAKDLYTADWNAIAELPGGINIVFYQGQLDNEKASTITQAETDYKDLREETEVTVENVANILSNIAAFYDYDGDKEHSKAYNDAKAESAGNVKNNDAWDSVQNTYVPNAIKAADALKASALQLYTMHKENSTAAKAVESIYTVIENVKTEAEDAWKKGVCDDNENTYQDALDPNKTEGKLATAIANVKSTIISLENSEVSVLISALKEQYNNAIAAGKPLEEMADYEKTIKGYEEELADMDFSKLTYDQAHDGLLELEGKIAATHKQLSDLSGDEAYKAAVAEIDATIEKTEAQLATVKAMVGEFDKLAEEFGVELGNLQASINAFKADYEAKKNEGTVLFYKNNLLNDISKFQPQIEVFATGELKTRYDVLVENRGANDVITKNLSNYWDKYQANKAIADTYTHEGYVYDLSKDIPELVAYRAKTEREIEAAYNSQVSEVATKYEEESLKYSDIQTYSSLDSKIEEYLKTATYFEAQGRINDTGVKLEGLTFSLKDYGTQTYQNLMEQKNSISDALTIVAKYNDDAYEDNTIMADIDGNDVSFTPDWAEDPQGIRCDYMKEAWHAIQGKLTELSGKINDFKIALEDEKVVLGDATGDKKVRVTDYEEVRRWILSAKEFEEIEEKLAYGGDVNSDKKFDVADLTCISGLIFEDGFQIPKAARVSARMRAAADANDQLTLTSEGEETTLFGKTVRMALNVENAETFTAGQLDITLPQGMKIAAQSLSDRANGHELLAGDLGNGTVRMVASTVENNAFTGHNGALIYLDVEVGSDYKGGQISIDNVIFTDAKANSYYLSKNAPILPTGVEGIQAATMKERIYSVGGQMLKAVKKGVNIITGENGTKKVISNK